MLLCPILQCTILLCTIYYSSLAIVGGGIGGSTVAHQLRKIFGSQLSTLDVYEDGNIGGRLQTVTVNGNEYEAGGAIIHPANEHMVNFAKLLGTY